MPTYKVTFKAVPEITYCVKANNIYEAQDIAEDMYFDEHAPYPIAFEDNGIDG